MTGSFAADEKIDAECDVAMICGCYIKRWVFFVTRRKSMCLSLRTFHGGRFLSACNRPASTDH